MPQFTTDWVSPHERHWRRILRKVQWDAAAPHTIVEVGSHEGRSTLWFLANLLGPDGRIYCIDIFEVSGRNPDPLSTFRANMREAGDGRVTLLHESSFVGLTRLFVEGVRADFIYIDGSHHSNDVLDDLVVGFKILNVGGLVICDDYLWRNEKKGSEDVINSPKIAIDAFTTIYRRKIDIIPSHSAQVAFTKRQD